VIRVPIERREIIIAFLTGAIMGVISYLLIRHIEGYVKSRVDGGLTKVGV
jgi:hypothetical protein